MAKVPLRTYNREIETLIERGKTDEAIAHCRHILKTFPKHLESYRLLGKAYLEAKLFTEASDIFRRVLMTVADDFVSHVGMSIISDDQKRLDDTIWHMERAFESQPSNAAVQAELQRLYGRRDGREPPKIRLTRGALAHMYLQGELYAQAIGEIRSVLAEDPNRTDMQVLLALAYFRAGQKVEASEACTQLIGRYPYCLEANRILVEILPGTAMAESAQVYRARVIELDPYTAYVSGSVFQSGDIPDNAVMLERLDYKGQPVDVGTQWESKGISLGAAPTLQPEWMKTTPSVPSKIIQGIEVETGTSETASRSEQIPDWMRSSGWGEATGALDESAASLTEEEPVDELAKADLPDWIKSMAPTSVKESVPPSSPMSDETMDWLNKLNQAAPPEAPSESEPAPASPAASDWLVNLGGDTPPAVQEPAPEAGFPDWVSELGEPTQAGQSREVPLAAQEAESLPLGAPAGSNVEGAAQGASEGAAGLGPSIGELGTSSAEQDAALLWLESLAAKQGAKSEELITNPAERLEMPPEWVEQARSVSESRSKIEEPMAAEEPAALPEESLWPKGDDTGIFQFPEEESSATDQTSAWLRDLAEKEEKEGPTEALPWSGETEVAPSPVESQEAEPASEAELPSWLRGLEGREPAAASVLDEMPNWLKGEEPKEEILPEPTQPEDWAPETPKMDWPVSPEPSRVAGSAAATPKAEPSSSLKPAKPAPSEARRRESRKTELAPEAQVVDPTKLRRTGMLPPLIDPALDQARDALAHGKIPDALQAYGNLIRKGKLLEDVTFDLKEALYRFPVEVSIWQVLGDAYMRANRLQDALDAYTKAEELLR